jgi:hypothetical protein
VLLYELTRLRLQGMAEAFGPKESSRDPGEGSLQGNENVNDDNTSSKPQDVEVASTAKNGSNGSATHIKESPPIKPNGGAHTPAEPLQLCELCDRCPQAAPDQGNTKLSPSDIEEKNLEEDICMEEARTLSEPLELLEPVTDDNESIGRDLKAGSVLFEGHDSAKKDPKIQAASLKAQIASRHACNGHASVKERTNSRSEPQAAKDQSGKVQGPWEGVELGNLRPRYAQCDGLSRSGMLSEFEDLELQEMQPGKPGCSKSMNLEVKGTGQETQHLGSSGESAHIASIADSQGTLSENPSRKVCMELHQHQKEKALDVLEDPPDFSGSKAAFEQEKEAWGADLKPGKPKICKGGQAAEDSIEMLGLLHQKSAADACVHAQCQGGDMKGTPPESCDKTFRHTALDSSTGHLTSSVTEVNHSVADDHECNPSASTLVPATGLPVEQSSFEPDVAASVGKFEVTSSNGHGAKINEAEAAQNGAVSPCAEHSQYFKCLSLQA